jgi:hypothetical protein
MILMAIPLQHVLQEKTAILKTSVFWDDVMYIHISVSEELGVSIIKVVQVVYSAQTILKLEAEVLQKLYASVLRYTT